MPTTTTTNLQPNALVTCDCCERKVSYFHDGGQFYSEGSEVLYRCEACQPEAIAAAADLAARNAEADAYYDCRRDLYAAGKPYGHDDVTAVLQRTGVVSVGGLSRKQAA